MKSLVVRGIRRQFVGRRRWGQQAAAVLAASLLAWHLPAGAESNPLCVGCHNADGNSTIAENPKLAGLDADYILRQLKAFKSGKRASPVMSAIIGQVDEKEFAQLASWFSEQKRTVGSSSDPELTAKGRQIYDEGIVATAVPSCSGCHNDDGSGNDQFPRLAGQHATYVLSQLNNFKSGARNNDARQVMQAVAKRMSEQDMKAVAEYIATLKGE